MAGVFRKAMVWLGLAPDEEYDDYGYDEPSRPVPPMARPVPGYGPPAGGASPMARPTRAVADPGEGVVLRPQAVPRPSGTVRPMTQRPGTAPVSPQREETPTVRPVRPTSVRPTSIAPESFDDAKAIADRFKADQPVVMDLSSVDRELTRRLIDFSSGICYALGGNMERVSPGVYLITPVGVEVSEEERRRLRSGR